MADKTVDGYIQGLEPWQAEIVTQVRTILKRAAPETKESIKWGQPVYESDGPFAYIKAFKKSVNFGFWRGVDLDDSQGLLSGDGDKMRHVKLSRPGEIDADQFTAFIHQALELNRLKGDPTKNK